MHRSFFFLIFILAVIISPAQNELISVPEGLSHRKVNTIIQDHNGFMWFGTDNGLNRYDGYFVTVYNVGEKGSKRLSNEVINCLVEDGKGNIWIGTDNGLNYWHRDADSVEIFFPRGKPSTPFVFKVRSLLITSDGNLWIGSNAGKVYRFNEKTRIPELISGVSDQPEVTIPGERTDFISCMAEDNEGFVWIVKKYSGVHKFSLSGKEVKEFSLCTDGQEFGYSFIAFLEDSVYLFSRNPFIKFNRNTGQIFRDPWLTYKFGDYDIFKTGGVQADGIVWIGNSSRNLARLDLKKHSFQDYSSRIKPLVFRQYINDIYFDKSGMLWLATSAGALKMIPEFQRFTNYLSDASEIGYKNKYRISTRDMNADQKGRVYVATYAGGIYRLDPSDEKIDYIETYDPFHLFPYRIIHDTKGTGMYVSSETGAFIHLDITSGERRSMPAVGKAIAMVMTGDTALWLGDDAGLRSYDLRTGKSSDYEDERKKYRLNGVKVWDILPSDKGCLWLGTSEGLFNIKPGEGVLEHYNYFSEPQLSSNMVLVIHRDEQNGNLWLGTKMGLNYLDLKNGSIRHFTMRDGICNNVIYGILESPGGILWISTDNGLSRMNKSSSEFTNFYSNDGLANSEYNHSSYFEAADGRLYFGGLNGIDAFYPFDDSGGDTKVKEVPLFLTAITRHLGERDSVQEILTGLDGIEEIRLSYKDRFITLNFALADYFDPVNNHFFYRLTGYDNSWKSLGAKNELRFNDLPSGNYLLELKGSNINGTVRSLPFNIRLSVSTAFYNTWWFRVVLAAALLSLVYLIIYFTVRYRIRQFYRLQHLRTKIASDLHDEVGGILTRIFVRAETINRGKMEGLQIRQEIEEIAQHSRLATSAMSDVLWSIDGRNDKLENLIYRMREHLDEVLTPLNINHEMKINGLHTDRYIDQNLRQNLFLIFKEAINNIVKHSDASDVKVILRDDDTGFEMIISDNGTVSVSSSKSGQGIRNMNMRAKRIDAEIKISDSQGYTVSLHRERL